MDTSKMPMKEPLSPEDYKTFFEALGKDVIASATDTKGDIIYASDKFIEVAKYSREELIGQNHRIIKSGYHPPEVYKNLWDTISNGKVWRGELKNKAKDGSYYWVDTSIAPILGPDGKPVKYVSVRFLITDRKKAEEQLISASYARSLIEASLDPLITINTEGKITDVNEAMVKVTGFSRKELIGSIFSTYFTEPEEAQREYKQAFTEGSVVDYPLTIRDKSGKLTDVLYNASVYKDDKGNVAGIFAAARDITEQKKIENQLHDTYAYARSLIEASLDSIITINIEGKITDVNHATELITGISREWLIGTDFSIYFTEPRMAREVYRKVLKEESVRDYPLVIRNASGKLIDVLYNATIYKDAMGQTRGIFAAARDNTRAKQAAEQLKNSNKDLEAFSYSVSHDLRAPLRAIDGFSKILIEEYADKLDDKGKTVIETIDASTKQMGQLIDDLLLFFRLGRQAIKIEDVDMAMMVKNVFDELVHLNPNRVINFTNNNLPHAQVDPILIRQVWENLLTNAIKFTRKKDIAEITVESTTTATDSIYSVKDNGAGFDMKYVDKLFEVFQRLHSEQDFPGTGIGLSIVQRIIMKHGGKVWAEGAIDQGATFYFSLPKVPPVQEKSNP